MTASWLVPTLVAALGFTGFQFGMRRSVARVDVPRATATLFFTAAAGLGLVTAIRGEVGLVLDAPVGGLVWLALAGLVHFLVGWNLLGIAQMAIGVSRTGIVIGTVPLFGALIALVVLDEPLGAVQVVGLVAVVVGVALVVSMRGGGPPITMRRLATGVAAALGTALAWSSSPILIRRGLVSVPSPVAAALVGMLASGVVALVRVGVRGRADRGRPPGATSGSWRGALPTLLVTGTIVAVAIGSQWTAFDRAPIAVVLATLQVTPVLVVAISVALGGERVTGREAVRLAIGTLVTFGGSLALVLTGPR